MAETETETPTTETMEVEPAATGFVASIKAAVLTLVPGSSVRAQFEKKLADKRTEERVGILNSAFDLLVKHQGSINKIKPKSPGVSADGVTKLPAVFSNEDAKILKETKEKATRVEAAINKALTDTATEGEWKALSESVSKNG